MLQDIQQRRAVSGASDSWPADHMCPSGWSQVARRMIVNLSYDYISTFVGAHDGT